MFFAFPITVPINTTRADPIRTRFPVALGTVIQVDVQFPRGVSGLAGSRALFHEGQLWPSNTGEYYVSDDETITWTEEIELAEDPLELVFESFNRDDAFPHTITWRVNVVPAVLGDGGGGVFGMLRRLLRTVEGGP